MKDERVYLGHIRNAINDIEEYTSVGRDAFVAQRMRQDAVIRKLEIIGEAVKQLSNTWNEFTANLSAADFLRLREHGSGIADVGAFYSPTTFPFEGTYRSVSV